MIGVPQSTILNYQLDNFKPHVLEYNMMWSTLSPIVKYMLMFRHYQNHKDPEGWRRIIVPERKLPRGFIVNTNYTMRELDDNTTYQIKVAAVNSHGQGDWSKSIHFTINLEGNCGLQSLNVSKTFCSRVSTFSPACQPPNPHPCPCQSVLPIPLWWDYFSHPTSAQHCGGLWTVTQSADMQEISP